MSKSNIVRPLAGIVVSLAIVATYTFPSRGQSAVSITFGSFGAGAWPSGPDYATDVLGDPWDFSNTEDVSLDPNEQIGWTTFRINPAAHAGQAGGTTTRMADGSVDTTMSLLYRGYFGILNPGRNGRRFPIDSSKYAKIAFRISDSAGGNSPQVYFFHYPWADPRDPNTSGYGVKILGRTVSGYQFYVQDLTLNLTGGMAWAADQVRGLRLDPNGESAGQDVWFDWVRLTARDGAPGAAMQTISWSGGTGTATVQVVDALGTVMTIASGASSPVTWNYGVLPPGTYTMRVTRSGVTGERRFVINAPAVPNITEPNETGQDDFAATVLRNTWDMDGPGDIQYGGLSANFTPMPPDFSGAVLTATNTNDDPSITVFGNGNNATPIDPNTYRYLTVQFQVDGAFDVGLGSVARLFWSSAQFMNGNTATTSKDMIVWPGMNSYTLDLATLSTGPDGGLESSGAPEAWTPGAKRHLRFDPHEFVQPRTFHIDGIRLASMFHSSNGGFTIKWAGADPDGGDPNVSLYYDNDLDPNNGKMLIASGVKMSARQYFWNVGDTPVGVYNIYVETNDGVQIYGRYASGPVSIVTGAGAANPIMSLDGPIQGSTMVQPFVVGGWAIDRAAPTGSGVDAVDVWAFPSGSTNGTYLGAATLFARRDDVGAAYGAQFANSGFTLSATGLPPGTYTIRAAARSTVTGTFNQSKDAVVTVPRSLTSMSLDTPAHRSTVGGVFEATGWAIDRAATSGDGVDYVDVWAFPIHSPDDGFVGDGQFVGRATAGVSRPDLAEIFGTQFGNAGFAVTGSLPQGNYRLVAYAHSLVSNDANTQRSADVFVNKSIPLIAVDGPVDNATVSPPFLAGGWAIDRGASTGTGVDAIHVWAFPVVNGVVDAARGIFVAQGATGGTRSDVGAVYGSRFAASGYTFTIGSLPANVYQLGVYARSTVTGTFNAKFVRITVN